MHRPSRKGTKLLFQVIKTIMDQYIYIYINIESEVRLTYFHTKSTQNLIACSAVYHKI